MLLQKGAFPRTNYFESPLPRQRFSPTSYWSRRAGQWQCRRCWYTRGWVVVSPPAAERGALGAKREVAATMTTSGMLPLSTTRLVLRRFTEADLEPFLVYRNDPDVARFPELGGVQPPRGGKRAFAVSRPKSPGCLDSGSGLPLGVQEAETLLGDCALHVHSPEARQATIGITLAQPYQGQGFATEALVCLLDYLFFDRGALHRVVADTDPQNIPAWTLLDRLGMHREGHLRQSLWFRGQWADEHLYAILCEEWLAKQE